MTTDVAITDAVSGMNPEVKLMWLRDLRSGEVPQATDMLTKLDAEGNILGHCCLGVLCQIAVREGVIPEPVKSNQYDHDDAELGIDRLKYGEHDAEYYPFRTSTTQLPAKVREWAGLDARDLIVNVPRDQEDIDEDRQYGNDNPSLTYSEGLAELNDSGHSFSFIADLIEKDL